MNFVLVEPSNYETWWKTKAPASVYNLFAFKVQSFMVSEDSSAEHSSDPPPPAWKRNRIVPESPSLSYADKNPLLSVKMLLSIALVMCFVLALLALGIYIAYRMPRTYKLVTSTTTELSSKINEKGDFSFYGTDGRAY
ncbi:uncharacterized protein LOC111262482 [Varroa jacobsoni]|uniref:uncharacterized protein LOC111262482 n=1 Tax=Varroa jacobsoni TaxID=62625 RepID=UPI000BF911D2|nr:uncharacterized protein LOC111262482 [Varroa jacobsoni]